MNLNKFYNILIVGAGFTGATLSNELRNQGHSVLMIDERKHIAGNAYDEIFASDDFNPRGDYIRYHKYGPHLFHTNNKRVWDYVQQFGDWIPYKHQVKALLSDGRYATLPVNRATKEMVGEENVIDTFFRPYTRKMWGMEIEELAPSILQRVPIRDDDNEYYFPDDTYQYIPKDGYTSIVNKMLDGIDVRLEKKYDPRMYGQITSLGGGKNDRWDFIFNCAPIDEFMNEEFGSLPYRSIKFDHHLLPTERLLPTATVNFTHDGPCTRMTEWKNIPGHAIKKTNHTLITYETPCNYRDNNNERFYPIKDKDGIYRSIYDKYKAKAADRYPNMMFVGRCGQYVYIDMHQAINSALQIAHKFEKGIFNDRPIAEIEKELTARGYRGS